MRSNSASARRAGLFAAALSLAGAAAVLPSAAAAEGFFEALRNAVFGRIVEVRPSYVALPREHGREPYRRDWAPREADFAEPRPLRRSLSGPMSRRAPATVRRNPVGAQTMCVRLCDGYAFPLGRLASRSDIPVHEAACASACPGASTALYQSKGSSLDPATARATADGAPYRQLATAFLFRKERVAACSCQGPGNVAAMTPILQDPTLRTGDVVVDAAGDAKVFAGEPAAEHPADAFRDVKSSDVIGRKAKGQINAIMGVTQREATARAFARAQRLASAEPRARTPAAFQEVAAPAGTARGVRVFSVGSPAPAPAGIRIVGASLAPAIYVIR